MSGHQYLHQKEHNANNRTPHRRTGPGHCYRLYSGACFNDQFPDFSEPEVLRNPIEDTVLQMKAMNIDNISAFPFPTPPDALGMRAAIKTLTVANQRPQLLNMVECLLPFASHRCWRPSSPLTSASRAWARHWRCSPWRRALLRC